MKLSQAYRTALIAIAGFLLTPMFYSGSVAQTKSLKGSEILSLFTGRGPTDQAGPK